MHPQSCQETQENQVFYGYPVNSNQYGQPVGNAWLNSNQVPSSQGIPSSDFNQQINCRPSQHQLSSQHGTYPPQASYHGNGSHVISSPNRNSVCPPPVSASVPTSGPYYSSCGYNIQADNSQMVQSHQGAVAQPTHIPSLGTAQDWHVRKASQTFVVQSTPGQPQSQTTQNWCIQTNSHTNMNVVPNGRLQMLSVQPQTSVNNLNVNRSSHSEQTLQLQTVQIKQPRCVTVQNKSSHPSQALLLQRSNCQPHISNQGSYGQHRQHTTKSILQQQLLFKNKERKKKVAQAYLPNSVNSELQNIQTNGRLSSKGPALQPTQSSLIPNGTYGQNVTLVSSPASIMASQCHYSNISTHTPPVSSNVQRLNPYPYGLHSQSAPSQDMNVPSYSNDLPPSTTSYNSLSPPDNVTVLSSNAAHTNQNNPTSVDNSPMVASPSFYSSSSTSLRLVSSGVNELNPPPYPYGPHSQSSPSQNMKVPSCSNDLIPSTTSYNSLSLPNNVTGVNGLNPPPYPGTYPQSAPSKNMNISSSGSSDFLPSTTRANCLLPRRHHVLGSLRHTSQNNHTFVDNSNRNESRAPNLGNGHSVHGPLAQQQNSSVNSPQQRFFQQQHSQRKADLYNHHTPNLHNTHTVTVTDRRPLLSYLLVTEDTRNIDQSIEFTGCHGSIIQAPPNKSVQIHRAVAVVPPISKQPGDGGKGKECDDALSPNSDDHHPMLMKDLQSLADDKEIKKAIVLPFDTDSAAVRKTCVKSAEVGCRPEADVTDESAVCHNLDSLNSLSPENKDAPKDQNIEELCGPDVFFGIHVVTYNLKKLKVLETALELKEEEERTKNESRMNNKPEFADAVLDLYWGGKSLNYTVAELDGTFENILKEAAEFDTEEDKMVFSAMNVGNLNKLKQKGHILTNCFDCDIAMEIKKSWWRNVNDESMDIDREMADEDFTREICGSLLEHCNEKSPEKNVPSSIQTPGTTSPHEYSVSKEDLCPSSPLAKDTASLYNENCTARVEQSKHVKPESQDDLRQKVTVSTNNNNDRQSVSRKENKEDDVSLQVSLSLRNLNRHSYEKSAAAVTVFNILEMSEEQTSQQCLRKGSDSTAVLAMTNVDSDNNSRDLDYEMNVTEEGLKLSERLCEEVETSEKDCPVSPSDTMLSIKLTALSSENEDKIDSENVHQDLISSPQTDPPSPSNEHSYESPKSPDEPMLSMKITVLSMEEFKALSKELLVDSDDSVHNVAPSSPICLDSEDDDLEVDLEHTFKTIGDLSQMMKQEKITTFEEEIPSFPSIEQVLKQCEIQTSRTAIKGLPSPLKDSRKEKDTLEHQLPSHNACRKDHALTTHQGAKSPGLEIHIPYSSSPRGVKASSPISPSAPIRTINSDVMKESSSLEAESSSASNEHEISSPTSTLQSVPLKKCRMEPLENSKKLTDVLCPSGHSPLKVTKKSNNSQKIVSDITKTPDNTDNRDHDVSLTNTSRENVVNLAGTSESPELPKSSGVHRKRKLVKFKLYGSQKVDSKEANGMNQYRSNCDRNLPPLLNILYSPDKTSAKDKIMKSWGDSFVPTSVNCRRLSSSVDKNREKNEPERPVNHYKLSRKDKDEHQRSSGKEHRSKRKSSGKDKDKQKQRSSSKEHRSERKSSGKDKDKQKQRSSSKEHCSDHRKRQHRSFSLGELRREAERMGNSKKYLQEKQDMGLHVIKRYQPIHKKV
ncbi:uncharacterized protein LOC121697178 isoform X1 [Alosa sapidissima]|uniref:uncharacterized protein LOC121697178 isoform X1 n=1 Tax=Alosa sapidissima TaxID=34773 RepID=UPI001C088026|nr:uncharacterized protein LOC121697178 isoform X1 [Alosa sapidissima]